MDQRTEQARFELEEAALRFALKGDGDVSELTRAAEVLRDAYETTETVPLDLDLRDAA